MYGPRQRVGLTDGRFRFLYAGKHLIAVFPARPLVFFGPRPGLADRVEQSVLQAAILNDIAAAGHGIEVF